MTLGLLLDLFCLHLDIYIAPVLCQQQSSLTFFTKQRCYSDGVPKKNPAAVKLGKLRAKKGDMAKIGALGGKGRAKPTPCPRCGQLQPTARAAWVHCRKPRKAVGKAPGKGKTS